MTKKHVAQKHHQDVSPKSNLYVLVLPRTIGATARSVAESTCLAKLLDHGAFDSTNRWAETPEKTRQLKMKLITVV